MKNGSKATPRTRAALNRAIWYCGSQSELARLVGCTQVAISRAQDRGVASPNLALAIDEALAPAVTKHDLRPDLWPAP